MADRTAEDDREVLLTPMITFIYLTVEAQLLPARGRNYNELC
jgi:hypothetical protein